MDYVKLGSTGLDVSRICLGCMSFGVPDRGAHTWTLDERAAARCSAARSSSASTSSTPPTSYSDGTSEEIVGRALRDFARRDEVVLATKVYNRCGAGRTARGLSRKAILTEIDASLRRLGMDYIDLYQIHRWDYRTPIEETLEALHDVVKSREGPLHRRLVDARLAVLQGALRRRRHGAGRGSFDAEPLQPPLSRGGARDAAAVRRRRGSASSRGARWPAGGSTAHWDEATERTATDEFGKTLYARASRPIAGWWSVSARSRRSGACRGRRSPSRGCSTSRRSPRPIVGASKPHHLDDAVAAVALKLTPEEMEALEEPYVPHTTSGFV